MKDHTTQYNSLQHISCETEAGQYEALRNWCLRNGNYHLERQPLFGKPRKLCGKDSSIEGNVNRDNSIYAIRRSSEKAVLIHLNLNPAKRKKPNIIVYTEQPQNKKQIKDITKEYNSLKDYDYTKPHPYLQLKKVAGVLLRAKLDAKGNLVIPVWHPKGFICSTQTITATKNKAGKNKFFKKDHPLPPGHCVAIGEQTPIINVAEGLATALSIFNITKRQTYVAFSVHNMDAVCQLIHTNQPEAKVVWCGDWHPKNLHKTEIKDQWLTSIYPEPRETKADFNDLQADELEKLKLRTLNITEAKMLLGTKCKDETPEPVVSFYKNLLLHHNYNNYFGGKKIGKTRAMCWIIADAGKENGKQKQIAILSTDNDTRQMLVPLIQKLGANNRFTFLNEDICLNFETNTKYTQRIEIFLNRIRNYLIVNNQIDCLFIDPLPQLVCKYNDEMQSVSMAVGLRKIAQETKTCIIATRNEGKNQSHKTEDLSKGSSAMQDCCRQVIRAVKCHPKSTLAKEQPEDEKEKVEEKPKKRILIYTELSSLFENKALLFKLEVKDKVCYPVFIKEIKYETTEELLYLASEKSGKSLRQRIINYLLEQPGKGATIDDIIDVFEGGNITKKLIQNCVYNKKHFDQKYLSGTTYVQLITKEKTTDDNNNDTKRTKPKSKI